MALIGSLLSILVVSVEFIPSTNVNNQILVLNYAFPRKQEAALPLICLVSDSIMLF